MHDYNEKNIKAFFNVIGNEAPSKLRSKIFCKIHQKLLTVQQIMENNILHIEN